MKRRVYTPEFKHQAVELVIQDNFAVKQVAQELEVHENSLYRWIQEIETYGDKAFPGRGSREYVEQNKIKQLEKENQRLQEELDLLKKFQVFIKKSQK